MRFMNRLFRLIPAKKREEKLTKAVNAALLENAERDLTDLRERADLVTESLDARRSRNHWRESIEQLIQGSP